MTPRQYVAQMRAREDERERDQKRADFRAGVLAAELRNQWKKKGQRASQPSDFFASLDPPRAKAQSPESMRALLMAFATAHNERIQA